KKRPAPTSSSGVRNVPQENRPKPVSAVRRKVETLKDTRDYSFLLSDDAELPVPKREPLSRSGSFLNSESQSAQLSARPKQQSSGINGRAAHGPPPREEKRPVVSANGHSRPSSSGSQMNHSRPGASSGSKMQSRPVSGRPASSGSSQLQHSRPTPSGSQMQQRAAPSGSQRPGSSINRQAPTRPQGSSMNGQSANRNGQPSSRSAPAKVPMDHRRQMSSSGHGVGPARSVSTSKPLPSRTALERKPSSSASAGKSSLQSAQRPSSRPMSSDPRQQRLAEQQRKVSRDPTTSLDYICRFVGVGEASFISLAAPFIDDNAPHKQKAAWLGLFYMCIPSGVALGYVYGGYVGKHFSWRYAFWGEAVLMAPFAVLGFLIKPLQLKGFPSTDSVEVMASSLGAEVSKNNNHLQAGNEIKHDEVEVSIEIGRSSYANAVWKSITQFARDMKVLCKERVFVVNVLGYVAYNFVIGAYSYWGPKAGYNIYKMKNADMIFGAVTIICGIVGTLSGGLILDHVTSTIPNAFKLLSGATFLGATCCFTAFTLKSLYGFVALFAIGELLVFATQFPVHITANLSSQSTRSRTQEEDTSDVLGAHPRPDTKPSDPDQTRLASARDRSSSSHLVSVRGSLGGPGSTICKTKVILILRT
ncbi:hypothetical protein F2Q70_00027682, partial [Brassica cretica]